MTKEEILKKQRNKLENWRNFNPSIDNLYSDDSAVILAMQEYADQQTESLKAELTEIKSKLELQENYNDMLVDELRERDKELTELKEKHKDFEKFDDFFIEVVRMNSLYNNQKYGLAEQVKEKLTEMLGDIMIKQKFESND